MKLLKKMMYSEDQYNRKQKEGTLITEYPGNHFLVTRHPDNRHKIHTTKEFVRNYKLFMQNKAKVK